MFDATTSIHFLSIAFTAGLPIIGTAMGQATSARAAIKTLNEQPASRENVSKIIMISLALTETAALLATIVAIIVLLGGVHSLPEAIAHLGIACALGIPGFAIGMAASQPIKNALAAVSRQPLFAQKIMYLLFLTLSIQQTPIIFGFLISLIIRNSAATITTIPEGLGLLASGLALGLGALGPALGLARFGGSSCRSIGVNRHAYNQIFSFSFVSQAMIETPVLFALVVSILTLFAHPGTLLLNGILCVCAAIAIGMCTFGLGIGSGKTAAAACLQIAYHPEHYATISRTSIIAQTLIDTNVIYGLLISFGLIFCIS